MLLWGSRAWTPGRRGPAPPPTPISGAVPYPAAMSGPGAPNTTPRTQRSSSPSVGKGFSVSQPTSLWFFKMLPSGLLLNSSVNFSLSVSLTLHLYVSVLLFSHLLHQPLPMNAAMLFCLLFTLFLVIRKDILTVEM